MVWVKANRYHKLPSEIIDPEQRLDSLTRYLADNAVTFFGMTIENALAERVNVGSEKEPKWEDKYTLPQLLDPAFRLPRPLTAKQQRLGSGLKAMVMANPSAVGRWKEVPVAAV